MIIEDVHQFIGHSLIPLDPCSIRSQGQEGILRDKTMNDDKLIHNILNDKFLIPYYICHIRSISIIKSYKCNYVAVLSSFATSLLTILLRLIHLYSTYLVLTLYKCIIFRLSYRFRTTFLLMLLSLFLKEGRGRSGANFLFLFRVISAI